MVNAGRTRDPVPRAARRLHSGSHRDRRSARHRHRNGRRNPFRRARGTTRGTDTGGNPMNESHLENLLDELVTVEPRPAWDDVLARTRRSHRRFVAMAAVVVLFVG